MGFDPMNVLKGIPIIGSMFDDSQQQGMDELKKNQDLYGQLKTPDFKQYDPVMAQAHTVSEDPSLRSAQLGALNRMAGLAQTGLSDVDQANFQQARSMGDQMANSGTQAALQNAEARGVGGSGMEYALREQANQAGAQRAQQGGLDQAAQSAQMKALYNQAYGSALGGMRGQDLQANSKNSDILNQFKLENTGRQNYGQQYNNDLAQRSYSDQLQKTEGMAGANTGMAKGYGAENAANQAERDANGQLLLSGAQAAKKMYGGGA